MLLALTLLSWLTILVSFLHHLFHDFLHSPGTSAGQDLLPGGVTQNFISRTSKSLVALLLQGHHDWPLTMILLHMGVPQAPQGSHGFQAWSSFPHCEAAYPFPLSITINHPKEYNYPHPLPSILWGAQINEQSISSSNLNRTKAVFPGGWVLSWVPPLPVFSEPRLRRWKAKLPCVDLAVDWEETLSFSVIQCRSLCMWLWGRWHHIVHWLRCVAADNSVRRG